MSKQEMILLAEEDPYYALLIQMALERAGVTVPLQLVRSRSQTLAYLKGEGDYADRAAHPLPAIVLLGLPLPLVHGFDVLRWIRSQRELDHVRVAILSGAEFPNEERIARELGADCYRVKPFDFQELVAAAERMRVRWLEAEAPHKAAA